MEVPIEGAMEKFLSRQTQTKTQQQPSTPATPRQGMIYVPGINLNFAKERTHLGLEWGETHEALASEKLRMPTIPEFLAYLKYLRSVPSSPEFHNIYNEITEKREPWRAEWLDAYFEERQDGLWILTENKAKAEKLEDCLMTNKYPGINLDELISGVNVTSQCIPKSNISNGVLYYSHPRNSAVARFDALSGKAIFNCSRNPSSKDSSIGVFAVSDSTGNAHP